MSRYVPSIHNLSRTFIIKALDFIKVCSSSNEMIMCLFLSVYPVDYLYGFSNVEPSLHLYDKAHLITVDNL